MNRFKREERNELLWKNYHKHVKIEPTDDLRNIINQLSVLDFDDAIIQYVEDDIGGFYNYIDVNLFFGHGIRISVSIDFVPEDDIISYYLHTDNGVKLFDNIENVKEELEHIIDIQHEQES
jgi:hypothetical protein